MLDLNLQTIVGTDLISLDFHNEFKNKRVLFCNITRPAFFLTYKYCEYLLELKKKYPSTIDQICLVSNHKWTIATMSTYFPDFISVFDKDDKLLNFLKHTYRKEEKVNALSKHWTYQFFWNIEKIESFYDANTLDNFDIIKKKLTRQDLKVLSKGKSFELHAFKTYLNEKESLIYNSPGFDIPIEIGRILLYQNIWPNTELVKKLESTTNIILKKDVL